MTATADDRSLNGNHTYSCALRTRGGVCDCWSVPHSVTAGLADPTSETDIALAAPSLSDPLLHARPV
jgi:hypothetical protein